MYVDIIFPCLPINTDRPTNRPTDQAREAAVVRSRVLAPPVLSLASLVRTRLSPLRPRPVRVLTGCPARAGRGEGGKRGDNSIAAW